MLVAVADLSPVTGLLEEGRSIMYFTLVIVCLFSSLSLPPITHSPFSVDIPEHWLPLDPAHDYELIPLNHDKLEFHMIASEFYRSLSITGGWTIRDVFRIQNPYLWTRYSK